MRGFSDDERDRIRDELVETGRELLRLYGPRKTNVDDVTEPVGIAKSTFYRFFDSKSELYAEIIERESEEFLEELEGELEGVDEPREGLERLFRCYVEFAEQNPLIQYREEFLNGLSQEQMEEIGQKKMDDYVPIVESLQERSDGPLAEHDPITVLGVMGTIGYLAIHREEFDNYREGYYDDVVDLAITSLARGLTVPPRTPA
ncbi:transcriptional regulator, TetR family [Halobiforma haloterrestris]|uniref:Transcriptional regulator, TetR family n=1 Tax=Natronobacterium haloterrestre TaxID=148448 RepID=A0A1I1J360_NATHA|nr:TetR/AcrR family transcriptional regulator [Halobiforma haloterrestris]SFC43039.1 transcriptional regulator, TetR family [Halobiforma haloterrestris]